MYIYPLDKQISVATKIIKMLESENVTFEEYPFINELVNDVIHCQEEDIKYPDLYHYCNQIKKSDTSSITIKCIRNAD